MGNKNWKKVLGILLSVCMMLTSAQIPGGVQIVRAEGESSQSSLQSSFATGGTVMYYNEDFQDYAANTELTKDSTLQGDGSISIYASGTSATAKVAADDMNQVLQLDNDGNASSSPTLALKIDVGKRTNKAVMKYRFQLPILPETTMSGANPTINLPGLRDNSYNAMVDLRIVYTGGKLRLRANDSSQIQASEELVVNTWYEIEVAVDSDAGTYSVYLNNEPVLQDVALMKDAAKTKPVSYMTTGIMLRQKQLSE